MKVFLLIRFLALVVSSVWAAKLPLGTPRAPAPSQKIILKFPGSAQPSGLYETPAELLQNPPVDSSKIKSPGEITKTPIKPSNIVETPVETLQGTANLPAFESSSDNVQVPSEPSGIYEAPSGSLPGSADTPTALDVQDQTTSVFSEPKNEHKTPIELVSISADPSVPVKTPSELVPLSTEFGTPDQAVQGSVVPSSLDEEPSKIAEPSTHETTGQANSILSTDNLETPHHPPVEHGTPLEANTGIAEPSSPDEIPSKIASDHFSASKETSLDAISVETDKGIAEHSSLGDIPTKIVPSDQHSVSKETSLDAISVETDTGIVEHSSQDEIPIKIVQSDQHSVSKETSLDAISVETDTGSVEPSSLHETPIKVISPDQPFALHEASSGAISGDASSSTGLETHIEQFPSSVQPSSENNPLGSSEHSTLHKTPAVSVASPNLPAGLYEVPLSSTALDKPSTLQETPRKPIIFPDTLKTSVQPVPDPAEPTTLHETPKPLTQLPSSLYEAPRKT